MKEMISLILDISHVSRPRFSASQKTEFLVAFSC